MSPQSSAGLSECLDWSLATGQEHGIWGGADEGQRRHMPIPGRIELPGPADEVLSPHGTEAALRRHRRRGEPACGACRREHAHRERARQERSRP